MVKEERKITLKEKFKERLNENTFKLKMTTFGWFSVGFYITFGLIIPILLVVGGYALLPDEYDQYFTDIFSVNMVILNAILYTTIFTFYQIQREGTFVRMITSFVCIGLLIYFYVVGSSLYTIYLPNEAFAQFGIVIEEMLHISFNYFWIAIIFIILQTLLSIREILSFLYLDEADRIKSNK